VRHEPVFSFVECFGDMLACLTDAGKKLGTRVFDLLHALLQSSIDGLIKNAILYLLCKLVKQHYIVSMCRVRLHNTCHANETILPTVRCEADRSEWLFVSDVCATVQLCRFVGAEHPING
jgi:hypothetical protein